MNYLSYHHCKPTLTHRLHLPAVEVGMVSDHWVGICADPTDYLQADHQQDLQVVEDFDSTVVVLEVRVLGEDTGPDTDCYCCSNLNSKYTLPQFHEHLNNINNKY